MQLLILTRTFPPDSGAVGHLVRELAEGLATKGHAVTVVAGNGPSQTEAGGVRLVRVAALPFTRRNHFRRALSYLSLYPALGLSAAREQRPDVIVTTTDPPLQAVLGMFLKWRFGCHLVHWSQDVYPELAEESGVLKKNGLLARLLRWISTAALRRHDRIVSIGRCMTDRLLARGLPREKIVEIENWTDPETLRPVPDAENSFWQRESLAGKFVVVYSGNLGLAHSFAEMLEAATELRETAPDVLFLFIGEGPRRVDVETEVAQRQLTNVRFLPSQPWNALAQSLGAGRVHLVSLRENLCGLVVPSKFYGGMAAGRPCIFIGPAECEVARLIREHRAGQVVEPGDGSALARVLRAYRDDPAQCEAEGRNARALGALATVSRAVDAFEQVFET